MDQFKQFGRRLRVEVAHGAADAGTLGTPAGVAVFQQIDSLLSRAATGTLVVLDFDQVSVTDVNFQREAIVENLRKHRPRLSFLASNISSEDVLANLEAALETRGERLLLRGEIPALVVIGRPLSDAHMQTLRSVEQYPGYTSSHMTAAQRGLGSSTASARLTALWRAGLVARVAAAAPSGGREYRYYPIAYERPE